MFDPRLGLTILGLFVLGMLLAVVLIDTWFAFKRQRPIGDWIATWSRRYPLFAAALALVFGGMIGHFFWPP